ncbi:SPX domain-containing protein [Infundibulicybe gibba]|nr:SPX domain-containing protein [Infundibulicybe gibba]
MHFSKTYAQLLESLPLELRENAIQYRQLKKLINQIVRELSALGLGPTVLEGLFLEAERNMSSPSMDSISSDESTSGLAEVDETVGEDVQRKEERHEELHGPKVVYEVSRGEAGIEPRLRVWLDTSADRDEPIEIRKDDKSKGSRVGLLLGEGATECVPLPSAPSPPPRLNAPGSPSHPHEVVIPLVSDTAFFQMLSGALQAVSTHLITAHADFVGALQTLERDIADTARPASETRGGTSAAAGVGRIVALAGGSKSDLNSWREIFQLYIEAEVFESVSEASRGERSVEESEERLKAFAERVAVRGLGDRRKLRMGKSRDALESFLGLNLYILNVKKFQYANAEATRKILKKHTKRTALRLPHNVPLAPVPPSLSHVLVQALGATLLPVVPHLDDYACLICTEIAFKPIRLGCGHLFCVRCLVKMQKRGKGNCPMCRAPCVLVANKSNVDWALLNFMQDWFPEETREKQKANERESGEEQLREMGFDPHQGCVVQ